MTLEKFRAYDVDPIALCNGKILNTCLTQKHDGIKDKCLSEVPVHLGPPFDAVYGMVEQESDVPR